MKIKVPYLTPHQYPSPKPQEEVALELEVWPGLYCVSPDSPSPHLSLADKCTLSTIIHFQATSPCYADPVHGCHFGPKSSVNTQ